MKHIVFVMFLIVSVSPAAFGKKKKEIPPTPLEQFLDAARKTPAAAQPSGNSLFSPFNPNLFLFHDLKAHSLNDIITIQIVETASATTSANTSTKKNADVNAAAPGLLGLESRITGLDFAKILQGSTGINFAGQGATSRSGDLQAWLTARVAEVLPNGDLMIEGTKDVTINRERQSLQIRGVVRPRDVTPENVVLSTAMAHMEVKFDGKGVVSNSNSPGFLTWLFQKINLF